MANKAAGELFLVRVWVTVSNPTGFWSRYRVSENGTLLDATGTELQGYRVALSDSGELSVTSGDTTSKVDDGLTDLGNYLEGWYSTQELAGKELDKAIPLELITHNPYRFH
ncbi:hypothetical protein A2264_02240 [candidate division WWE3 bacterium RIFOXYA2_FULL_46_9]|uniref:Uncharacterized protein n=1 Tax=candidate division WWE3 bacterium RIFOXYA2_FULL_46_9 TaxID=1802636 RepID=A0A1F4VZP9_UNCKA|nr:MAG: hypothetical protein A2264_02240 [candidate division WWE3 bacterium RIFOXYA2_FULL_46_9]OGC64695.1 MAG: hypothetical protein A2326_01470 [candidate division WWE3 bacterium RIFOXYB2_FULL_41_6]HLD51058.1 hypothetical protein [Patescibacteria group bacterium]